MVLDKALLRVADVRRIMLLNKKLIDVGIELDLGLLLVCKFFLIILILIKSVQ